MAERREKYEYVCMQEYVYSTFVLLDTSHLSCPQINHTLYFIFFSLVSFPAPILPINLAGLYLVRRRDGGMEATGGNRTEGKGIYDARCRGKRLVKAKRGREGREEA